MYNLLHIKEVAKLKNVTVKKMLEDIHVGETGFYNSLRNGEIIISTLDKIADYLNISISELISDNRFNDRKFEINGSIDVGVYKKLVATQEDLIKKQERLHYTVVKDNERLTKQVEKLKNEVELSHGYSMVASPPVKLKKK